MSVRILLGDVMQRLSELPPDFYDCVVTSPPYWGLRDYGVAGQIGLEPTLADHLAVMVEVFRAVRRVLKPGGTLWLNYGDCYATTPNGRSAADTKAAGNDDRTFRDKPFSTIGGALKPKDLCMIPNRLAIALQEDGWWVRSEIIWAKPNPMPESIKDRPGSSHEKIFLLTKSPKYFYDAEAVREPATKIGTPAHLKSGRNSRENVRRTPKSEKQASLAGNSNAATERRMVGFNERYDAQEDSGELDGLRNIRNVWTIATSAFSESHFATFPPKLVERCLKAGCPPNGRVLDPFGGAGTTALVADGLGMDCDLIELNENYAVMARRRIAQAQGPLLENVQVVA